ncbi:MAG: tRNA (adenosine(37)-N6)-dimethylallyltransferase MiaA [Agriterribacter sp.]
MHREKYCIVIVGPTASGKTALSLQLADHFKTAIISADSRQCYKELNIGVAKPEPRDIERIRHYFINSHSIHEQVNAGVFELYALKAVDEIFAHNGVAIMVGGTGLYIKAFCEGVDDMPSIDEQLRSELRQSYQEKGIAWLQQMLKEKDEVFYEKGEMQNPQRMLRALEIKLSSGQSILDIHSSPQKQRPFTIIKIGIDIPRALLYQRINRRVDEMIEQGLIDEVKSLEPHRNINALQTVGYKEILDYLDGTINREQAILEIKKNTRHYAKRQLTWFKKDTGIHWFDIQKSDGLAFVLQTIHSHSGNV